MLNTFRAYDPSTINAKSYSTACEACYSRKVKCAILGDGTTCKQCADHNVECKPRTRKRKAQSLSDGQHGGYEKPGSIESPNAHSRKHDTSDASSTTSNQQMSNIDSSKPWRAIQRSNSVSVPLFVNRGNGSDVSPTNSGHTDPASQDKFRNKSYLSRSAILGNDFQDIDHAHVEGVVNDDKLSSTELKVLQLYGAFDLPAHPLRQSLVEAYIERCYTWMPVVDLWMLTGSLQNGDHSFLLLQAVILVGSLMRPDVCGKTFIDQQYQRVKALIHSGHERNPLNILAACCLIQWYTPTAPKDISTDVPRFWNTYAVGLAQQLGMQRESTEEVENPGLRNRIWSTMRVRDNLTASAHGRPRIIQPEDCTVSLPTIYDFPEKSDSPAEIFIHYVKITQILGDLCQLITRNGGVSTEGRQSITVRLHSYLATMPESLRLYSPSGLAQQYNLELVQLHVPILMTAAVLFRPRTVFQLSPANAVSATAAFLSFRIFQAIELREQTRFLGSPFAWHLLVTAIPLLSCTKVEALRNDANEALDAVECVLETLARVRPAAAQNVRNVRAIRKAMDTKDPGIGSTANNSNPEIQDSDSLRLGYQIVQAYGSDATRQYEQIADILGAHCNNQAERTAQAAAHTLSSLSGRQEALGMSNGHFAADNEGFMSPGGFPQDIQNAFTAVFEDDTLSSSWLMRDWMDELQT